MHLTGWPRRGIMNERREEASGADLPSWGETPHVCLKNLPSPHCRTGCRTEALVVTRHDWVRQPPIVVEWRLSRKIGKIFDWTLGIA